MTSTPRRFVTARNLYWVSFVIGVVVLVVLGLLPVFPAVPAIGAVAVMLAYLGVSRAWTSEAFQHPDFADGFYYMGFLLTLVALVTTLVRIGGAEREGLQRFVLMNFGLALATTIVGLLGRTALRMFSEDDTETGLNKAQDDLRKASERFRIVLKNASVDTQTTLGAAQNTIESGVQGIKAHLDAVASRLGEIERSMEPLGDRFEGVGTKALKLESELDSLGSASTELKIPFGGLRDEIAQLGREVANSHRGMSTFADTLHGTIKVIPRVEELVESLDHSVNSIQRFASTFDDLPDLTPQVNALADALSAGQSTIEHFINSTRSAEASMERLAGLSSKLEKLESLAGTLEAQIKGLERSVQTWQSGIGDLDSAVRELQDRQKAAAKALLDVNDELKASVHVLTASIDGMPQQ